MSAVPSNEDIPIVGDETGEDPQALATDGP